MKIYELCGKGGVGKTNSAVSLALHLSQKGEKTAILDYDGGHSVKSTLGLTTIFSPNVLHAALPNLYIGVVENSDYIGILASKAKGMKLKEYFAQFPGDFGLIPLTDMVNAFFGILTDISTIQKFATLVTLLRQCKEAGCQHVIIDVEPTAGLERMLSHAESTAKSLINLKNQGIISLTFMGAKWPDIRAYLKGDYIQHAERHSANIEQTVKMLTQATFLIVAIPEAGPVNQTYDVRKIIEKFGGRVRGYVINNIRGEPQEKLHITRLEEEGLPVVKVKRAPELHTGSPQRLRILSKIGESIAVTL